MVPVTVWPVSRKDGSSWSWQLHPTPIHAEGWTVRTGPLGPLLFPRNVLTESARIARGKITDLAKLTAVNHDAAIFPGGFGAAKNLYVLLLGLSSFSLGALGGDTMVTGAAVGGQ